MTYTHSGAAINMRVRVGGQFPSIPRATFQNSHVFAAGLDQSGDHAGAFAGLADQDDGNLRQQIVELGFDLLRRDKTAS